MSGTTDMTSWDLGQQEEDLENSKFRERAFHESICADAGRRYGETDTVMCVVINVVTGDKCNLCSDAP